MFSLKSTNFMTWVIGNFAVRVPIVFRIYLFTREVHISRKYMFVIRESDILKFNLVDKTIGNQLTRVGINLAL